MKDNKHVESFGQFNGNLNISDVSDSLNQLEIYVVDRISFLGAQIDKFPDADNDILLGRLQEAKEIRSQIWKLKGIV